MNSLTNIPLSKIVPPEIDARDSIDRDKLQQLADSIKRLGLLQPILVKEWNNQYEIEAGHRRYLAFKLLDEPTIPAIILCQTQSTDLHLERAHENLVRENLTPLEEARQVSLLVNENSRGIDETAKLLSKSKTWVESRLDVLQWPDILKIAIGNREITLAVARELKKITDPEQLQMLLTHAIDNGVTANVARQWIGDSTEARYIQNNEDQSEAGHINARITGATMMRCFICGSVFDINAMQHIWLCAPDFKALKQVAEMEQSKKED